MKQLFNFPPHRKSAFALPKKIRINKIWHFVQSSNVI